MGSTTVSRDDTGKGFQRIFNGNGLKAYGTGFAFIFQKELFEYMRHNKDRWSEPTTMSDFKLDLTLFKMKQN